MGGPGSGRWRRVAAWEHECSRVDSYHIVDDDSASVVLQVGSREHVIDLVWCHRGVAPRRQFICPSCQRRCESLFVRGSSLLCRLCAKIKYCSVERREMRAARRELAMLERWHRRAMFAAGEVSALCVALNARQGARADTRPDVSEAASSLFDPLHIATAPPLQSWGNNIASDPAVSARGSVQTEDEIRKRRAAMLRRIHRNPRIGL